ncbi:T9SS type A sorting domain-containing protein [bacterium]|nr:T9SS type A sorting domain-containing protein [bacterium]
MGMVNKTLAIACGLIGVLAGVAGPAIAQPQAPIEWGEVRWLGFASSPGIIQILPMGDTLAFYGLGPQGRCYTSYSYDNGLTISAWRLVQPQGQLDNYANMAGCDGHVMLVRTFIDPNPWQSWVQLSSDGGSSWSGDTFGLTGGHRYSFLSGWLGASVRTQLLVGDLVQMRCAITLDAGQTWASEVIVPGGDTLEVSQSSFGITRGSMIIIARQRYIGSEDFLHYSVSEDSGGSWSQMQLLPGQPNSTGFLSKYCAVADRFSPVCIVSSTWNRGIENPQQRLWIHRTVDGGSSWESARSMTDSLTVRRNSEPTLFCRGKLFGVAWPDVRGTELPDLLWRFSANHGRNWYPEQAVIFDVRGVEHLWGQFDDNSVRIYWIERIDSASGPIDARAIWGAMTPDTIPPEVVPLALPPDTVAVNAQILFLAAISDNDMLSQERLRVCSETDSVTVPMTWTGTDYMALWRVPHEGRYWYRIEGEDWWENVGGYPDSSWAMLVTPGWVDAVNDPYTLSPSTFNLSVYPNPSNSWPTIRLSSDWLIHGQVTIEVFNLLGQSVGHASVTGNHYGKIISINEVMPEPVSSGIYWIQVRNNAESKLAKILLLR